MTSRNRNYLLASAAALIAIGVVIACSSSDEAPFGSMPADFLVTPFKTGDLPATFLSNPNQPVDKSTFIQQMLDVSWELNPFHINSAHAEYRCNCPHGTLHGSGQGNAGALMRAIEAQYPKTQYFDVRTTGYAGVVNIVSGWLASWGFYERSNTIYSRYNAVQGAASTNDNRGYGGWSW